MIRSIFITKSPADRGVLYDFCNTHSIDIHYHSFLTFKQVDLLENPSSDVLFFSSKRAVDYYLQQTALSNKTLIACIGDSTKSHLETKGFQVDFVGENAGKPSVVSQKLSDWLGTRSITIVLAKDSKQSILTKLDPIKTKLAVVYETVISAQKIDQSYDCYVFTSPSNVAGFLNKNLVPTDAFVIAWGETTKEYLLEKGIESSSTLEFANEAEVVSLISIL